MISNQEVTYGEAEKVLGLAGGDKLALKFTKEYARTHDTLDAYGIPRYGNGNDGRFVALSLEDRVQLLANKAFFTIRVPRWLTRGRIGQIANRKETK